MQEELAPEEKKKLSEKIELEMQSAVDAAEENSGAGEMLSTTSGASTSGPSIGLGSAIGESGTGHLVAPGSVAQTSSPMWRSNEPPVTDSAYHSAGDDTAYSSGMIKTPRLVSTSAKVTETSIK